MLSKSSCLHYMPLYQKVQSSIVLLSLCKISLNFTMKRIQSTATDKHRVSFPQGSRSVSGVLLRMNWRRSGKNLSFLLWWSSLKVGSSPSSRSRFKRKEPFLEIGSQSQGEFENTLHCWYGIKSPCCVRRVVRLAPSAASDNSSRAGSSGRMQEPGYFLKFILLMLSQHSGSLD